LTPAQADGSLCGVRVLITRPRGQAAALAGDVRDAGGEALELPTIAIDPLPRADVLAAIGAAAAEVDLIIFISVSAVAHGGWLLREGKVRSAQVAAIGETTAKALQDIGIAVPITPATGYTSEALLAHPALAGGGALRKVLIVRGRGGRELLARTLRGRGATVAVVDVYARVRPAAADASTLASLRRTPPQLVTATSVEILHNLLDMLGKDAHPLRKESTVIVPSERVAEAVVNAGFRQPPLHSDGAGNAAMLAAMKAWRARQLATKAHGADDTADKGNGAEHQ
jgi:uroporphyrinogen-III synthase